MHKKTKSAENSWEDTRKMYQNLKNSRKTVEMIGMYGVGRKEHELKLVRYPSGRPLPDQHLAYPCASGRVTNRLDFWATHAWTHEEDRPDTSHRKSETGGIFAEKYFSLKTASEHACIIN